MPYLDVNGVHTLVVDKMMACWFEDYAIPAQARGTIAAPTLVMVGDDDIVRLDHTIALYDTIPDVQLAAIPGASHLSPIEKPELVNRLIFEFLAADGPPTTMVPLRRASS